MAQEKLKEDVWMHGIISAAILILLVLFSYPSDSFKSIDKISNAKIEKIEYVTEGYRAKRRKYAIEIKIRSDERTFKITGTNYQEANHEFLKDSVRLGTVVDLDVARDNSEPEIYSLVVGGKDILNQEAVSYHRSINSKWALSILGYCLVVAVMKITAGVGSAKTYKYILIIGVCLIFIYYCCTYGMKYITKYDFR